MMTHTVYSLEASNVTVSGGKELSGYTVGGGSHLAGETITLNNSHWVTVDIHDLGDTNFDDNDPSQTLASAVTYDGTEYAAGLAIEAEYMVVVQDPDGNTYSLLGVNINEATQDPDANAYGTVEGLAFVGGTGEFPPIGVPLTVISTHDFPKTAYNDLASPPCFTAGCRIQTPGGWRAVETLRAGDVVMTRDHGAQVIRWAGQRAFGAAQLRRAPRLRPVRILQGALGDGLPERDLLVSRQHRMLLHSGIARRMFNASEVLVPAIKLTSLPGIFIDEEVSGVTYYHLLFDRHEILFAEGAPTESLLTGPQALKSLPPQARREILSIFPEIADPGAPPKGARFIPSGRQQNRLIARHLKNHRPCIEPSFEPFLRPLPG